MYTQAVLNRITLVAHRGYSGIVPENTLAAFAEALNRGYRHIEFDVQLTKDGVPVIIHDITLERTTNGTGAVKDYTLDEIKAFDAGSWFDAKFKDLSIPTLREALIMLKGRAHVHIELKSTEPELPAKVAELLKDTGWLKPKKITDFGLKIRGPVVIISSSDRSLIVRSQKLLPLPVVHELIVDKVSDESLKWASLNGLYSYHPDANDVTQDLIRKGRKLHLHIGAWWWDAAEQDISRIKGARYAFVDSPDAHRSNLQLLLTTNRRLRRQ